MIFVIEFEQNNIVFHHGITSGTVDNKPVLLSPPLQSTRELAEAMMEGLSYGFSIAREVVIDEYKQVRPFPVPEQKDRNLISLRYNVEAELVQLQNMFPVELQEGQSYRVGTRVFVHGKTDGYHK